MTFLWATFVDRFIFLQDALTLQRVCLEAKAQLIGEADSNDVPDVPAAVQEILLNLFISTFNNTVRIQMKITTTIPG